MVTWRDKEKYPILGPMRWGCFIVGVLIGLFGAEPAKAAPSISEYQSLTFGEMTITGTTVKTIVITPDGSESHDAGITPLLPGRNAILKLMDFPVNTIVSAMADDSTLDRRPTGASFDITSFTFDPDAEHQVTDGNGALVIRIGATLKTRAGVSYAAGPYRGTYNLLVNY